MSSAQTFRPSCDAASVPAVPRIAFPDSNNHRPHREDGGRANLAPNVAQGERSALEQRTRATQRITALGEMTGGIAHDFRNILAIIGSGLRLAERNAADPEKVRVCLAGIGEGVGRGLELTSQLLAFAKRPELDAHAENANDLLRNLELFLKYGAGPGIRIVFALAPHIPKCLIDPSEFNTAILNLVVNARDAMPDGGEIQISTEVEIVDAEASDLPAPGAYVRVRVTDNGRGMSAETTQSIFDPYFTTKGEKGTGLGLPQVAAFMRLIGGHVGVRSEPGQGTRFDLLFPSQERRPSMTDDFGRQLDRWVNEGGAGASDQTAV